jgi:hypothetical protein
MVHSNQNLCCTIRPFLTPRWNIDTDPSTYLADGRRKLLIDEQVERVLDHIRYSKSQSLEELSDELSHIDNEDLM